MKLGDIVKYKEFTVKNDGFAGHLVEPDGRTPQHVVIIIMGGERSIINAKKVAERFTEFGISGIAVPVYGAKGQKRGVDRVEMSFMKRVVRTLRNKEGYKNVSVYGLSVGSVYAAVTARYVEGIDNAILVAPSHVPFEGSNTLKQKMTGHSMVTYEGVELPFVSPQFFHSGYMAKFIYDEDAGREVSNMWRMYNTSYKDKTRESLAYYELEKSNCRYLFVAGTCDEVWPSEYSINYMMDKLKKAGYTKEYKALIYPNASHIIGMLPSRERYKWQRRMLWLIGKIYRSYSEHREDSVRAVIESEKAIAAFIFGNEVREV